MKTSLLLCATLICALASNIGGLAPAFAEPLVASEGITLAIDKIPSEARALMPPGAQTQGLVLLPIGAKGAPILLHSWAIPRPSSSSSEPEALCCVDLFYRDEPKVGQWKLASSIFHAGDIEYPVTYSTRWLHTATKQGVVIVEEVPEGTGTTFWLITLPKGVPNVPLFSSTRASYPHFVDEFWARHSGGDLSSYIDFGADTQGEMTVEQRIQPHTVAPQTHSTYAWRENHWAQIASQEINSP